MTVRRVVDVLRTHGASSRADLVRRTGISAPTISKAVASLLDGGLLEEADFPTGGVGRPGRRLSLASRGARVLGVVLDSGRCEIVAAGLDGAFLDGTRSSVRVPRRYTTLLDRLEAALRPLVDEDATTLAIGISTPGLIDRSRQEVLLSPNLPATNGRSPAHDLSSRLGVPCLLVQESHALCLAERMYGGARGVAHFAMIDATTGLGLGVMQDGRLVLGERGLAGELGHLTIEPDGLPCGCGNSGCLETRATDAALARAVSERLGRDVDPTEAIALAGNGGTAISDELELTSTWLSIAVAGVMNIFNPAAVFVHSARLAMHPESMDDFVAKVRGRALGPSAEGCRVERARGSKVQGAVAGALELMLDEGGARHLEPTG